MKAANYLIPILFLFGCSQKPKINYPVAHKDDVKDTYFGVEVEDPYRWLEDDNSAETAEWVKAENEVTFKYLEQLPGREKIKARLTELWDFPKYGVPFKEAGKYFFYKNNGLQNQSVLYISDSLNAEPKVLLDPNLLSNDGTVALSDIEISDDGKYLVYMIARSGSDWNEIFVKNIETGEVLKDHIQWVKFSGLSWDKNGFYYSAYNAPEQGKELQKSNENQMVKFHKLGTDPASDPVVYCEPENPKRLFGMGVTDDGRFLILSKSEATSGNALSVKDNNAPNGQFVVLMDSFEFEFNPIDNIGDDLFVLTNYKAPKYRLIKININQSGQGNWKDIIPETENVIEFASIIGGKIVVSYMKNACSQVKVFNYDGTFDYDILLPGIGSIGGFSGKKEEPLAFYSFASFNTPGEIYQYNFETKETKLHFRPEVKFNPDDFEVSQVFYNSKDGTRMPMFIFSKKGIKLDGNNPVLLYSYGGFNVSMTPAFSVSRLNFVENGGVFAMPNIRGGGEYGEEWHKSGTKMQKQNVFDDFIAAAEYLIKEGYTSPKKLAVMGGSNGGLLIGAVVNQRPELFGVALPQVGVMDMLRYHKFTIGWAWAGDYGTSDDSKEMFEYLYKYSPYHNINGDLKYPPILATTADHDDRVVPAHTFKYMARLQELYKGKNPVLVRIETKAGHGAGKPTSKSIEEYADLWAFTFFNLGVTL